MRLCFAEVIVLSDRLFYSITINPEKFWVSFLRMRSHFQQASPIATAIAIPL
ncbi:hypothetical protein [Nostoc sp.]|uniref:hypothetical protein n=1 Tax=Nostoc sp. TaxID=1180 RepID=UPI002FF5B066